MSIDLVLWRCSIQQWTVGHWARHMHASSVEYMSMHTDVMHRHAEHAHICQEPQLQRNILRKPVASVHRMPRLPGL